MSEEIVTLEGFRGINSFQTENSVCMNDSISHEISTLELLPDEIHLALFSYIKPIDLYRGFVNLNQRMNNILNDIHMCIHIVNNDECENDQACLNYFAIQIIYLAIDCHWSCLSYDISLQPFVNLRSLHLPMPTNKQCLEIIPDNLPYLTNLTVNNNAFMSILFTSNSFLYLETCCVPRVYSSALTLLRPMQLCSTLRSLQLCCCSMTDLFDILTYVPNLNYLEVLSLSNNRSIHQPYIKHYNISRLRIKLKKLDPNLEILLKIMPNLHRLEFLWYEANQGNLEKDFNFEKLGNILENNSPSLKHVDVDIYVSKWDYDIDSIRHLNLQWFSSLSIIRILDNTAALITTHSLASNAEENMIMNILQSTYVKQRHVRFNQVKNI